MPFQKGNQLAKLNIGMKYSKTQTWDNLGMKFMSGFTDKYSELLEKLAKGEEVSKSEIEFMDRYERQEEYFKPKLARNDNRNSGSQEMIIKWQTNNAGDNNPVQPKTDIPTSDTQQ